MAPTRFRYQHPMKGDMGGYNNGEPLSLSSLSMRNRQSISVVSAVALAALAAALAAIATAIGAINILCDRIPRSDPHISPSGKGIFRRTLRSTSFHTSVDYGDAGEDLGMLLPPEQANLEQGKDTINPSSAVIRVKGNTDFQTAHTSSHFNDALMYADSTATTSLDQYGSASDDSAFPMIAWLMSFPNSGTSYTIHLIREVSNTTTATNYGLEGDIKDEPSVPVDPSSESGPFLELIKTIKTGTPPRFILTKTHCTGFCAECTPESYIETPRSFQKGCLSGRRGVRSKDGKKIQVNPVRYEANIVKKAVHIIRNPFDNVVARFHLEHKRHKKLNDNEWPKVFPNTKDGFQKWCASIDANPALTKARWVDGELAAALAATPCHAEFFRYVQWHNLAFSMARDMALPTFVFHYEDYSDHFDDTLNGLLDFLELPSVKEGPDFELGKEYGDYYTEEQRASVTKLIKELSSLETWNYLQQYFLQPNLSES
uniref:Sulfotransferase domain-containing protein n=1 Tax=Odontella aurita TaxID=265563 RepID=A0A7S4HK89_9STRA|mmetsp:Transcript_113/g.196  ORF Transcript_113/g.196 Transcript_113/m.196 type:complete len:486 (+) Transcript_113:3-1460(+)